VTDEQGTHMQLGSLDLQELEAQRAELVPDRVVMRRRKKKRRNTPSYPPDHPCAFAWDRGLMCAYV
jgi:hypothetical protein